MKLHQAAFLLFGVVGCGTSPTMSRTPILSPIRALEVPESFVTIGCGKTIVCPKVVNTDAWFEPERKMAVQRFWLDVHEASGQEFVDCGEAGGCEKSQLERPGAARITYGNAVALCRWRGGRLPTSVEWEAAARGNDGRIYPWGNTPAPTMAQIGLSVVWNYDMGTSYRSAPTLPAGPYGHADLAGGAAEFVQDPMPGFHLVKGASGSDGEGEDYAAMVTQSTYGELYASKPESFAGFRCAYDHLP